MATKSEQVSVTHKQFSQIVKEVDPEPEVKTAYRFSSGRRFKPGTGPYEPPSA